MDWPPTQFAGKMISRLFMDASTHLVGSDGRILGLTWTGFWTVVGWLANAIFTSRFLVQWYATEKRKQVTVPALFWWLSLMGSLMFLLYAIFYDRHWVIIFAYAFTWIPYSRNIVIHYRHQNAEKQCGTCAEKSSPRANFCPNCGARLASTAT
jgi:lipid-A-disaccharide synthase-like uncharacterized protein